MLEFSWKKQHNLVGESINQYGKPYGNEQGRGEEGAWSVTDNVSIPNPNGS